MKALCSLLLLCTVFTSCVSTTYIGCPNGMEVKSTLKKVTDSSAVYGLALDRLSDRDDRPDASVFVKDEQTLDSLWSMMLQYPNGLLFVGTEDSFELVPITTPRKIREGGLSYPQSVQAKRAIPIGIGKTMTSDGPIFTAMFTEDGDYVTDHEGYIVGEDETDRLWESITTGDRKKMVVLIHRDGSVKSIYRGNESLYSMK